jgi:hypothetical protein
MLAAAALTPYPPSAARGAAAAECPGSVGGFGEDDFVLHTSQSYIRASQPVISPNVAAGLAAAEPEQQEEEEELQEEEEDPLCGQPFTTPSQNSKVIIIIITPCKPYLSASATAPHPLGRRKAD